MLLFQSPRILKKLAHIAPDSGFQELASDLGVAADSFAPKSIAICSAASVVAKVLETMPSASLVGRFAVVRITAYCTTGESLQEVPRLPPPQSGATPIVTQLALRRLK
jgi:hypothetical protein